jgi:hypothetical protein
MSETCFFKLSDLQQMFGVSRTTLWRWREDMGLRTVKIGGIKRITEKDLQEFLGRHLQGELAAN